MARKRELRDKLLQRRRKVSVEEWTRASESVCRKLMKLSELASCQETIFYCAFDHEVSLNKVIVKYGQQGKKILLPRFNQARDKYEMVEIEDFVKDTVPGHYGIIEPRPELPARPEESLRAASTTWLIPGVGFDRNGRRLGRGKGYYDRLLTGVAGFKIGIGYGWQLIEQLPEQEHDQKMDMLISEKCVIRISGRRA